MRDYKHVKVPRTYRAANRKTTTKRVSTSRPPAARGRAGKGAAGMLLGALLAVLACYGAWEGYRWLTHAELFQVARVDVSGVRSLSEAEVRELAGMFTGQNVFHVDLEAATHRAMADPRVKDVRIERRLPNRISMFITERVPEAVLQASNGQYFVDNEGVVMIPAPKDGPAAGRLPVISVRDLRAVPREAVSAGAVREALDLVRDLAARGGWDPAVVTVKADAPETLAILYADHEFRIGSGNYDEKLRRLGEIVTDMRQRGLEYSYVELRPERQAAVMLAKNVKERGNEGRKGGRTGR